MAGFVDREAAASRAFWLGGLRSLREHARGQRPIAANCASNRMTPADEDAFGEESISHDVEELELPFTGTAPRVPK